MYVTFLYEIDRSSWLEYTRPFDDYLKNFQKLLEGMTDILIFGDDDRVEKLAKTNFYRKPLKEFFYWSNRDRIENALQHRLFNHKTPEFFSAEYIALQLCKFEALEFAARKYPNENIVWIDGGLRPKMIRDWNIKWSSPKIHVTQMLPIKWFEFEILTFPCAFILGGCFGGPSQELLWLSSIVKSSVQELWAQNKSANDQQILSILFMRYPEKFIAGKIYDSFRTLIPRIKWDHACIAVNDDERFKYSKTSFNFVYVLIVLVLVHKLKRVLSR